ncbi:hypothetical protein GGI26_004446 [Coemansia sp. RSA 1358]|nr:hypothetical protein EDC05_006344 [Coemansia umbellata]KAJ2621102.1 hypothetical protein GGI26_004446 [Coemansia sp. RSA 1358]
MIDIKSRLLRFRNGTVFENSSNGAALKFYLGSFLAKNYVRRAINRNGGKVLDRTQKHLTDFTLESRVPRYSGKGVIPYYHPRLVLDSLEAGRVLDPERYKLEGQQTQQNQTTHPEADAINSTDGSTNIESTQPTGDKDLRLMRDLQGLLNYNVSDSEDGMEVDLDDSLMDSFLSSHSRDLSDFPLNSVDSPGGQSTGSLNISDNDYRVKMNLDASAQDLRTLASKSKTPNPPKRNTEVRAPNDPSSAPQLRNGPTYISPKMRVRMLESPTFNLQRSFENDSNGQRQVPKRAALISSASSSFIAARSIFESSSQAEGTKSRTPNSPELEMPVSQAPMTDNFEFIQAKEDSDELNVIDSLPENNKENKLSNVNLLYTDSSDEEHSDPQELLAAHTSTPLSQIPTSHIGTDDSGAEIEETKETAAEATELSVAQLEEQAEKALHVLGKRRRTRNAGSGYGGRALPVFIAKDKQNSMPDLENGLQTPASLQTTNSKSFNLGGARTPNSARPRLRVRPWSASKRIRISNSDSPEQDPVASNLSILYGQLSAPVVSDKLPLSDSETAGKPYSAKSLSPQEVQQLQPNTGAGEDDTVPLPVAPNSPALSKPAEDSSAREVTEERILHTSQEIGASEIPAPEGSDSESEMPESIEVAMSSPELFGSASVNSKEDANETPKPLESIYESEAENAANDSGEEENWQAASDVLVDESSEEQWRPEISDVPFVARPSKVATPLPLKQLQISKPATTVAKSNGLLLPLDATQNEKKNEEASGSKTQPIPSRQRRLSTSRPPTICQRLIQLNQLSNGQSGLGIQITSGFNQQSGLLGLIGGGRSFTHLTNAFSVPPSPARRAAFSGTMRVFGEGAPDLTDSDRLGYMRKMKGLIQGTNTTTKEALRILYFFTGDWIGARRYIVDSCTMLPEHNSCMWTPEEDEVLLQGLNSKTMEELRERKGNVEVYRRLQFLNTFHGVKS